MSTVNRMCAALAGAGLALGAIVAVPANASSGAELASPGFDSEDLSTNGTITVVASDETADGGWIAYTGEGRVVVRNKKPTESEFGPVAPYSQRYVGGGTWVYGSYTSWTWRGPRKTCYSKYYHGRYSHSASAKLGNNSSYNSARAGRTAKARVKGSAGSTCHAYWRR